MSRQQYSAVVSLLALLALAGCQKSAENAQSAPTEPPPPPSLEESSGAPNPQPRQADRRAEPDSEDVLKAVLALNTQVQMPPAKFDSGAVEPLVFDGNRIKRTESGFSIQLPSESPIPTPTVHRSRLYVSGGFSSEEYYCFDALSGDLVWTVQLDDDGPTSAVPYGDSIIFGCESCTIFSLAAETGEMLWSHWLGDPLLSMPAVANGRAFAVFPGDPAVLFESHENGTEGDVTNYNSHQRLLRPSHIAACFDIETGELLWQRWIESDSMTAPVATSFDVVLTTLTGTVYQIDQQNGQFRSAQRLMATSVPTAVGDNLYLTRRADSDEGEIAECIVKQDRGTDYFDYVAARRPAPYLDQSIQRGAAYSIEADSFETPNGIGGGGYGGGFGGGGSGSGFGGGGLFAVGEDDPEESNEDEAPPEVEDTGAVPLDALGVTELQAAETIGLGNVSTLQGFQGSRLLYWNGQLFNCMGDRLVCTGADTGREMWSRPIEGDLLELGGHLASPPIAAGESLLLTTVSGLVLQVNRATGETLKSYEVGSPVRFPPVVDQGRIYIGTQNGKLVCIDTGNRSLTGWPMWGRDPGHTNVAPTNAP